MHLVARSYSGGGPEQLGYTPQFLACQSNCLQQVQTCASYLNLTFPVARKKYACFIILLFVNLQIDLKRLKRKAMAKSITSKETLLSFS